MLPNFRESLSDYSLIIVVVPSLCCLCNQGITCTKRNEKLEQICLMEANIIKVKR